MAALCGRTRFHALILGAAACSNSAANTVNAGSGQPGNQNGSGPIVISSSAGTMEIYGLRGGPFPQGTRTYRLHNSGATREIWRMDASERWLTCTPAGGVLEAGERALVTVEIDHSFANGLAPGDYPSELNVRSQSEPQGRLFKGFELHVLPLVAAKLRIDPSQELVIHTHMGSTATSVDGTVTVENTSSSGFTWAATSSESWLQLQPPGDRFFEAGEIDTLEVLVDESALNAFGLGTHEAQLEIFDEADPSSTFPLSVVVHLSNSQSTRVTNGLRRNSASTKATATWSMTLRASNPPWTS